MAIRLQDNKRVILDSSGNGSATFGPQRPSEKWTVTRVSVKVATNTLEAVAQIYRGTSGSGSRISGTFAGSSGDDDPDLNEDLWAGEYLTVVWTGGDVGSAAVVTYWGTIETRT